MTENASPGGASGVLRREWVVVACLTLLAGLLRLWRLGELPPGLHVDEAFNLLDVRSVIEGWRPVFLPANAGREVLFTYLQAPFVALLGESPGVARLVSALAGTALVPVAWAAARELPLPRARRVAVLAAGFVALSYWHLHFSRFGIRAVLFPLVAVGALWAWWRTVRRVVVAASGSAPGGIRHPTDVLPTGVLLGLAVYAHPLGRALFLVPVLDAAWHAWRVHDRRPVAVLLPVLVVAALVAMPAGVYWLQHPDAFAGHAAEVAIVSQGPPGVAANALKVAGMFNVAGDPAAWRNLTDRPMLAWLARRTGVGIAPDGNLARALSGRPVFDPPTGILFLAGLAMTVAAARRGAAWASLALVSFAALVLPSVITDAAPNFSRTLGAVPIVCVLPALALDRLADRAHRRWGARAGTLLAAAWLGMTGVWTAHDYFVAWAGDPTTPLAFDAEKVALARFADARASEGRTVYTDLTTADHPSVRVVAATPPRGFDLSQGLVVPPAGPTAADYVLPRIDPAWHVLAERLGSSLKTEPIESDPAFRGAVEATVGPGRAAVLDDLFLVGTIHLPRGIPDASYARRLRHLAYWRSARGAVTFGNVVRLLGAQVPASRSPWEAARGVPDVSSPAAAATPTAGAAGSSVTGPVTVDVTLVWEVLSRTDTGLSAMVHLTLPDGTGVADGDGAPIGGSYPTTLWRTGEVVLDTHRVALPTGVLPEGDLEVRVGWYDWQTRERLPVTAGPDALVRENGTAVVAGLVRFGAED